jgi:hypothetical protein
MATFSASCRHRKNVVDAKQHQNVHELPDDRELQDGRRRPALRANIAVDLVVGYRYACATKANCITGSVRYQQVNLSEYYAGLYALRAYQRANGKTPVRVVSATPP